MAIESKKKKNFKLNIAAIEICISGISKTGCK
jgi:hypothetical protein